MATSALHRGDLKYHACCKLPRLIEREWWLCLCSPMACHTCCLGCLGSSTRTPAWEVLEEVLQELSAHRAWPAFSRSRMRHMRSTCRTSRNPLHLLLIPRCDTIPSVPPVMHTYPLNAGLVSSSIRLQNAIDACMCQHVADTTSTSRLSRTLSTYVHAVSPHAKAFQCQRSCSCGTSLGGLCCTFTACALAN